MTDLQGPARLGFDPRLKYVAVKDGEDAKPIAELRLNLINYKKLADGESEDRGFWVQAEIWDEQAELAAKYLKKGDKVFVIGDFFGSNWESDDGPQSRPRLVIRRLLLDTRDLEKFQFKPRRSGSSPGESSDRGEEALARSEVEEDAVAAGE